MGQFVQNRVSGCRNAVQRAQVGAPCAQPHAPARPPQRRYATGQVPLRSASFYGYSSHSRRCPAVRRNRAGRGYFAPFGGRHRLWRSRFEPPARSTTPKQVTQPQREPQPNASNRALLRKSKNRKAQLRCPPRVHPRLCVRSHKYQ